MTYCIEKRKTVLMVYNYYNSMRKVSKICKVSIASISRWLKDITIKKRLRKNLKLNDFIIEHIKNLITITPFITIYEIVNSIYEFTSIKVSKQLVHNVIKKTLKYSWKRIRKRGVSKSKETLTSAFKIKINKIIENKSLIFSFDESGFDHKVLPIYGYSSIGKQCLLDYIPSNDRQRYNLLMLIGNDGSCFYKLYKENVTKQIFQSFINGLDLPINCKIVMDNASIHKGKEWIETLQNNKKIEIVYIPPYSPEMNPIELVFGIIKNKYYKSRYFKKLNIEDNILEAIKTISQDKIKNVFNHTATNYWIN
jgi:transposase